MASRMSLRCLTAALVAGLALSLTPTAPVLAADGPGVQAQRVRSPYRVRTVVQPAYDPYTCGGCAATVAVPYDYAPRYHAPRYHAYGCGGCALPVALPYYWAVRYARYRYARGCCYY
jgi:hypothetical protein